MSARVLELGHIGIYVKDLELMRAFYRDFLGMHVTKSSDRGVFLSGDPDDNDHEIALLEGRQDDQQAGVIQQISLRVATLDDLRDFHRRIKAAPYRLDALVTHASAIGCYFRDPENNPVEVFWRTGLPAWVMISRPIDIDRPDNEVLAEVHDLWETIRHVAQGQHT